MKSDFEHEQLEVHVLGAAGHAVGLTISLLGIVFNWRRRTRGRVDLDVVAHSIIGSYHALSVVKHVWAASER